MTKLRFLWLLLALVSVMFVPNTAFAQAQAVISWTVVADVSPTQPTTYKIQRNADGGAFAEIGTTATTVVSFTDAALSLGVLYCWQIVATNNFGDAQPSAQLCGATNTPGQVLGVQVILSPIP